MEAEDAGFPHHATQAAELRYGPRSLWVEKLVKNSEAGLELILLGAFTCRGMTVTCWYQKGDNFFEPKVKETH